jgi:dTMP kinase
VSEGPDVEVGVSPDASSVRTVLRNDSFRNLLLASVTSSMGDWIGLFALISLAETLQGTSKAGALAVSLVMIARIVPTLFFAPIAGVFVDRWDRQRTMVVTDIVRGAIMILVAFVGDVFQLVMATFAIELASSMFIPAKDAVVPTIVPKRQLVHANQLSLMSTYVTLPLGALLCAVVIQATTAIAPEGSWIAGRPEAVPILFNALSFFVSIIFINRMDVPDDNVLLHAERDESPSALRDLKDGFAFIAGMPLIRALILGVMAAFLAAGAVIGVGTFFATITNAGSAGFALLGFIVGFGLVLGIGSAGFFTRHIAKERLFAPGIVFAGAMLVVAAFMPTLWIASVPVLLMGLGSGVSFITGYTMLQENSEDALRGRVFATFNMAIRAALFATLVLGPLMIVLLGVEQTQEQIEAGEVIDTLDKLEAPDANDVYPYSIGGVRLTLMSAGLLAMLGAGWSGLQIAGVFRERREDGSQLQRLARPVDETPVLRGLFIVFEGGEGAGKSTQVRVLRAAVEKAGYEVVVTREPGGTVTGERVREVVLDADGEVAPRAEALLYAAARAQHTAELLVPSLERGAIVICDRFVDSSIVYQGTGRGLGRRVITELNRWATDDLVPDLVILLDVEASVGLARARTVDEPDRLEAAGLRFHQDVNAAFLRLAAASPDRYLVVDATESVEQVQRSIRARVRLLMQERGDAMGDEVAEELAVPTPESEVAPEAEPETAQVEPPVEPPVEPSVEPPVEPETAQVEPPVEPPVEPETAHPAAAPEASNGPDAVPDWLRLPTEVDDDDEVRVDLDADIAPAGQDGGQSDS